MPVTGRGTNWNKLRAHFVPSSARKCLGIQGRSHDLVIKTDAFSSTRCDFARAELFATRTPRTTYEPKTTECENKMQKSSSARRTCSLLFADQGTKLRAWSREQGAGRQGSHKQRTTNYAHSSITDHHSSFPPPSRTLPLGVFARHDFHSGSQPSSLDSRLSLPQPPAPSPQPPNLSPTKKTAAFCLPGGAVSALSSAENAWIR